MSQTSHSNRFPSFWVAWSVTLLLIVGVEAARWANPVLREEALSGWLSGREADWLPFLPIFLAGLVIWLARGVRRGGTQKVAADEIPLSQRLLDSGISLGLGVLAVAVAASAGWDMRELPPAYHDEFSYLFQALTFLDGRTSNPSFEAMPQLFDQVHVLNEGRFASRYFPGAGAWFAVFHEVGTIWGQWIAQGIVAVAMSIVAGEMAGRTARVVAGLAVAFSPGLCLFSQTYLAHHPTLVGLSLFLVAIMRLRRVCESGQGHALLSSFFAGLGLSYAMLCRPMTAAGIGLPFGVWLFWWAARSGGLWPTKSGDTPLETTNSTRSSPRLIIVVMGLPILAGIAIQMAYNRSITGKLLESPYQLYTDVYTPRHVYGFNNVERGEQHLGPKVLDNYDRWAENLTLPLAIRKMGVRAVASGRWTLGLVPMAFVVVWIIWNWRRWSGDFQLIVASIVSLHIVHLPYWFEGIMGWHYVFESAPLWAIALGVVTADFVRQCRETGHTALRWWWGGVLLTSLATAWLTVPPLWPGRVPVGLIELRYPRSKYAEVAELFHQRIPDRAIVFIRADDADRHIDYVYNTPRLDAMILRARAPQSEADLHKAIALFPDRKPWLFDASSGQLQPLDRP